jgi:uncharacterized Zn finger protein (UPF0148 family)
MPNCTSCGRPLKDGAMFCAECGVAVKYCRNCGQLLKDGAMFCARCGAAVNEVCPDSGTSVSPSAPLTGAVATQGSTTLASVRFTLPEPSFAQLQKYLAFHFKNNIYVDGYALRAIEMGETVEFELPAGNHMIQLEHIYPLSPIGPTIPKWSNQLQVTVVAGTLLAVAGEYEYVWQNFNLRLQ